MKVEIKAISDCKLSKIRRNFLTIKTKRSRDFNSYIANHWVAVLSMISATLGNVGSILSNSQLLTASYYLYGFGLLTAVISSILSMYLICHEKARVDQLTEKEIEAIKNVSEEIQGSMFKEKLMKLLEFSETI